MEIWFLQKQHDEIIAIILLHEKVQKMEFFSDESHEITMQM
jgi:hypothetical protein